MGIVLLGLPFFKVYTRYIGGDPPPTKCLYFLYFVHFIYLLLGTDKNAKCSEWFAFHPLRSAWNPEVNKTISFGKKFGGGVFFNMAKPKFCLKARWKCGLRSWRHKCWNGHPRATISALLNICAMNRKAGWEIGRNAVHAPPYCIVMYTAYPKYESAQTIQVLIWNI